MMDKTKTLKEEGQRVLNEADCLFTRREVEQALDVMANDIRFVLGDSFPVILCVMNGGLIPTGLLLPRLDFLNQLDYIHATRYKDKIRGGELEWKRLPDLVLENRPVLLIDDIHDEGVTLDLIKNFCIEQGAYSVHSAVIVNKLHDRKGGRSADFSGLDVPDRYVFGYGMDYKGILRSVAGIYAVRGL